MSDLVGNPEDRFSHDAAHLVLVIPVNIFFSHVKMEPALQGY